MENQEIIVLGLVGFDATEIRAIRSMCLVSALSNQTHTYQISEAAGFDDADIVLIDLGSSDTRARALAGGHHDGQRPMVMITDKPLPEPLPGRYVLPRRALGSRILRLLDSICRQQLGPQQSNSTAKTAASNDRPSGASTALPSVLIVDHSPLNREILSKELKMLGISADTSPSAADALRQVSKRDYDLIFLAIEMPEMNGYQACKYIKADHPNSSVVMLTSECSALDKLRAARFGCDKTLSIPVDRADLRETIQSFATSTAKNPTSKMRATGT